MGGLLKAPDTVERRIRACDDGFKVVYFQDVCPNGCYLFPADDKNVLTCPISTCQRSRYKRQDEAAEAIERGVNLNDDSDWSFAPAQSLSVVSVGAALAQLMINEDKLQLFKYRRTMEPFDEVERIYRDIWDGELVRNMMTEGQCFENKNDIGLLLFVDGFQPKNINNHTMTIVHCLVMSIDPSNR